MIGQSPIPRGVNPLCVNIYIAKNKVFENNECSTESPTIR